MFRTVPRAWLLVALSSVLQILSFPLAGPVPLWRTVCAWFSLVPFLLALLPARPDSARLTYRGGFLLGYGCGILFYLGDCSWILATIHTYGGLPVPVAILVLLLFSMYLGLYHGVVALLVTVLVRGRLSRNATLAFFPALWVAVELARGRVTGFPWDLLGNSQVDNLWLDRLAPLAGVMAMSFAVAAVNALLAFLVLSPRRRRQTYLAAASVLIVILDALGSSPTQGMAPAAPGDNGGLAVMLQENLKVGASDDGDAPRSLPDELRQFITTTLTAPDPERGRATVVVWPEAPSHLRSDDPAFRTAMAQLAGAVQAPLIIGSLGVDVAPDQPRGYRLFDSASLFSPDGTFQARYDKVHLVPWGEYIPYKELFGFATKLTEGVGDMDPGTRRTVFRAAGHTYGVFICYESIFGDEVRHFALNGAEVLVNISDDGWYGDSGAPWQHLNMARMRAIENRRWLLRDTNTGETTVISPDGLYTRTPRHIRTAFVLPFGFRSDLTFYTRYGDWFAYLCMLVTLGALGLTLFRRLPSRSAAQAPSV